MTARPPDHLASCSEITQAFLNIVHAVMSAQAPEHIVAPELVEGFLDPAVGRRGDDVKHAPPIARSTGTKWPAEA